MPRGRIATVAALGALVLAFTWGSPAAASLLHQDAPEEPQAPPESPADADTDANSDAREMPTPIGPVDVAAAQPLGLVMANTELVMGPTTAGFDTQEFVTRQAGYLANYFERVDGEVLAGSAVVDRVAVRYSVGPRVLLALIETASGWVTTPNPAETVRPLGGDVPGLAAGLAEAADALNRAYYAHRYEGDRTITLGDGSTVEIPGTNAGSFAVLAWLARDTTASEWAGLEQPSRFHLVWSQLFLEPYWYQTGPLAPQDLELEEIELPLPPGEVWFYVRGPHPGWGTGAAWSTVDFAPPGDGIGSCAPHPTWAVAAAGGDIVYADSAMLIVDVDRDGLLSTGWTHVYLYLSALERAEVGTRIGSGDRLGHPGCSSALGGQARVGIGRRYNGEWVPADSGQAPMIMGGWVPIRGVTSGEGRLLHPNLPPRIAQAQRVPTINGVAAAR